MTGPELQHELAASGKSIPIVFITGVEDEAARVRLMQQGAVDCLFKPFSDDALHQAVKSALGLELTSLATFGV